MFFSEHSVVTRVVVCSHLLFAMTKVIIRLGRQSCGRFHSMSVSLCLNGCELACIVHIVYFCDSF